MGFISDNICMPMNYDCSANGNLWCYDFSKVFFVQSDGLRIIEFKNYAVPHSFFSLRRGPEDHMHGSLLFYCLTALCLTYHRHLEVTFRTDTQNRFSGYTYFILCIRSEILDCSFFIPYFKLP